MNKLSKIIVVLFSSLFLSFAANSVEVKFGHVGKPGSLFSASVDHFAKLANKNKIKTINCFLEEKNLKKIRKNADIILASNVFAHSDKLKEMAKCMLKLLKEKGTLIIEVQYLLNTLKDLTFDNIYHEHYNYWSLTSLLNFFNQFDARIVKAEKINTHGGSLRAVSYTHLTLPTKA